MLKKRGRSWLTNPRSSGPLLESTSCWEWTRRNADCRWEIAKRSRATLPLPPGRHWRDKAPRSWQEQHADRNLIRHTPRTRSLGLETLDQSTFQCWVEISQTVYPNCHLEGPIRPITGRTNGKISWDNCSSSDTVRTHRSDRKEELRGDKSIDAASSHSLHTRARLSRHKLWYWDDCVVIQVV